MVMAVIGNQWPWSSNQVMGSELNKIISVRVMVPLKFSVYPVRDQDECREGGCGPVTETDLIFIATCPGWNQDGINLDHRLQILT